MESKQLPKYKCHKEVQAFKITNIKLIEPNTARLSGEGFKVTVSDDYIEKHKPHIGGYYVVYEDGYESFSPAKAFEAGYTRLDT